MRFSRLVLLFFLITQSFKLYGQWHTRFKNDSSLLNRGSISIKQNLFGLIVSSEYGPIAMHGSCFGGRYQLDRRISAGICYMYVFTYFSGFTQYNSKHHNGIFDVFVNVVRTNRSYVYVKAGCLYGNLRPYLIMDNYSIPKAPGSMAVIGTGISTFLNRKRNISFTSAIDIYKGFYKPSSDYIFLSDFEFSLNYHFGKHNFTRK